MKTDPTPEFLTEKSESMQDLYEDGSVVWDDHATRYQACLDIAATPMVKYNDGESIGNIRNVIGEQFKGGYAEPTPTPEVYGMIAFAFPFFEKDA